MQCCHRLGSAVDNLRSNVTDGYDQVILIATESRTRAIFRYNNSTQRFLQITDTCFGDNVMHSDYAVHKRESRIKRRSFQERTNKLQGHLGETLLTYYKLVHNYN